MSEIGDKGKAAGEKAKALADAGIEKLKSVDWKAQGESAKEKATVAKDKVVSLWRSGTKGKVTCIVAAFALVWVGSCLFCGSDDENGDAPDVDTLVIKGLYMGQPGDDAVKACRKIAPSDLAVVDFRKGIEFDKEGLEKAQKEYERWVMVARTNVLWRMHIKKRGEMSAKGKGETELVKMGLKDYSYDEFAKAYAARKIPPRYVVKDEDIKKWLEENRHNPPNKLRIAPKNLIAIAIRDDSKSEDRWNTVCDVWIDEADKVKKVYFEPEGIDRIFNAGDLSAKEFAQKLVDKYDDISELTPDVQSEVLNWKGDVMVTVRTYTWTYKDPRGFQVQFFDRVCDLNGKEYDWKWYKKTTNNFTMLLCQYQKGPRRFLSIQAIKSEAERKFD